MSATELLEQVKAHLKNLPAEERQRFFEKLVAIEESMPAPHPATAPPLRWPDVESRHRRIFGDQVLNQNIVLAAREEEPY